MKQFDVTGMSCAACSARVEKAVLSLGVKSVEVNLLTASMSVDYDEDKLTEKDICAAVKNAGYGAEPKGAKHKKVTDAADKTALNFRRRFTVSVIFCLPLFYLGMGHMWNFPLPDMLRKFTVSGIVQLLLCLPIIAVNISFFTSGIKSLFKRSPNMNSLIALGSGSAFVYSLYLLLSGGGHLYFETSGMILTLICLGKFLESRSKSKTAGAITSLMDLSPKTAVTELDGEEKIIMTDALKKGDTVIIKAGDAIPADGTVIYGDGTVNKAMLTGENMPEAVTVGDKVIGATILQSGYIKVKIDSVGGDTVLAEIIRLVEEASAKKAPISQLADKVSGIFLPIVIGIAAVTFAVWILTSKSFDTALTHAIAVTVISCPCALGLATPTSVMVGTGKGASLGILIKSGEALETAHKIKTVVLDKTGTVTVGKPEVVSFETFGKDREKILAAAAAMEKNSNHPLAFAIVSYAGELNIPLPEISNFETFTGKGISATVNNKRYFIGNADTNGTAGLESAKQPGTSVLVTEDGKAVGEFVIKDRIKDDAKAAVSRLESMGIKTVMLTGDTEKSAKETADSVGVSSYYAGVMPSEKQDIVLKLKKAAPVAMVGDGINDAPALTAADVGIAIGAGTDVAIESADIVLMGNGLGTVATAIELSRAVINNIKGNLFWALFYNSLCIPLATGIFGIDLDPSIAAAAMSFSSIFVVGNALRLRNFKVKKSKGECNMQREVFIDGMMCEHCAAHVKTALEAVDGIKSASVELKNKRACISTDKAVSDDVIIKAVADAGYTVTEIK